jgi:hypothetical protein
MENPPRAPEKVVRLTAERLYVVESSDETVRLALTPVFADGVLRWGDTARPRAVEGTLVRATPNELELASHEGIAYRVRPLGLREYNERLRGLVEGAPLFSSEEELAGTYFREFGLPDE